MSQNLDFLPEDYVERRSQQRTVVIFILLFLIVMGGILAAYMKALAGPRRAQAENDSVSRLYDEMANRSAQVQQMEQEKQRMVNKAEVTAVLLERVPRSRLLRELTERMPQGVTLISLDLKSREIQPVIATKMEQAQTDAKPELKPVQREVTVNLVGLAPTDGQVASFIASLGKSPVLSDVNLLFSEEFKPRDKEHMVRRFKVEMKLNPEADMISPETK